MKESLPNLKYVDVQGKKIHVSDIVATVYRSMTDKSLDEMYEVVTGYWCEDCEDYDFFDTHLPNLKIEKNKWSSTIDPSQPDFGHTELGDIYCMYQLYSMLRNDYQGLFDQAYDQTIPDSPYGYR